MRKKITLLALTAVLILGSTTRAITVSAAESVETLEVTEEEIDAPDTDSTPESTEDIASTKETTLTITNDEFVADSFNGVDAIYRPGKNDGSNATYSCAAYIKKYYKEIYGVSVYNLYNGRTPLTYEGISIKPAKAPKVGDIAGGSSHWAIVKSVDKENKKVVLIEQNWKWSQGGQTVCKTNRTVSWDSFKYYRLAE